ncbi:MAG: type III-B CRISPR module RAMP protein Cmr1 [Deltaproteobacteria bacterium]
MQFECKTLTPLFSGGPLKDEIEFRPHIIKSSMRYWWRALNAHLSIEDMFKEETRIFGMGGENSITGLFKIFNFNFTGDIDYYPKLPHDPKRTSKTFSPQSAFQLDMQIKNNSEFTSEKLIALMQITSSLGNLGNRARRGMGAWQINEIDGEKFKFTFKDLFHNIQLFSRNYSISSANNSIGLKAYSRIETSNYPYIKTIFFDEKKVMKEKDTFLKKLMNTSSEIKGGYLNDYILNIGNHTPRLASPVYISIIEIDSEYYPIITRLNNPKETNNDFVENYIKKILE